ncbi:MAG: bifunctional DNA-formamidopyrimidine glycosylase/DNA-(apurinic or apyrimidinic site) lyase [Planctomycetes bacterium]|nr:bifunctional DNA-formamidopyrimidine glycosylase/DNA-(apurinic or apyrimidinic site) lyase [Planctomycetota bacterium]
MPELPEVETVARLIRPHLVGRRVVAAHVAWRRTLGSCAIATFERQVVGARFASVERRAKYIVMRLEPEGALVGHLRMTGRMHVEDGTWDPGKFAKVRLDLDDGRAFHFIDVRKFGRLEFVRDPERALAELGPEPLGEHFTFEWLRDALRGHRRRLKPLLLDQTFLAGLGNIYVDESLHRARLHPLQLAARVSAPAARALHREIRSVLSEAIEREGSSFDSFYRTPEGNPGGYQDQFQVYGRAGLPCRTCATPIRRLVVGQRGTHVCPRCQPAPRRSRKP